MKWPIITVSVLIILTIPLVAEEADEENPMSTAMIEDPGSGSDRDEAVTLRGSARDDEGESWEYNPNGEPNPFVPLILPTQPPPVVPTPRQNLISIVIPPKDTSSDPTPTPVIPPDLNVASILIANGVRPVAMVNRRLVHVGDTIDKAEVVSIEPTRVVFLYMGQQLTMRPKQKKDE